MNSDKASFIESIVGACSTYTADDGHIWHSHLLDVLGTHGFQPLKYLCAPAC